MGSSEAQLFISIKSTLSIFFLWLMLFFPLGCAEQHVGSQFPDQGSNLCPLTAGPQGSALSLGHPLKQGVLLEASGLPAPRASGLSFPHTQGQGRVRCTVLGTPAGPSGSLPVLSSHCDRISQAAGRGAGKWKC